MAGIITLLDQPRTIDALGRPTSAVISFWLSGTTTLATIYADEGLTTPAANPVVISSGQFFPDIYLDPAVEYRRHILYGDGSIHDVDPLNVGLSDSSQITYSQAGTGAIIRTVQARLRDRVSIADFGTTADATSALNKIKAAYPNGVEVYVPAGTWTLTAGVTFDGQRFNIVGDGPNVSVFAYNPVSAGVALTFNNTSLGGMYQGSITGIGFTSSNSVNKTAIRLVNCADFAVERIGIPGGAWQGTGSIGLESSGRQSLRIEHCQILCARPLVFTQNATFTSLNTDHFLIEHCELSTSLTTGSSIEFANGVMHTNTTLRNLALTGGKYGIYWNDSTSVGASYNLLIENVRTEQGADATGYSIYLAASVQNLQTVLLRNILLDNTRNGVYLRNALRVTMGTVFFNQGAGQTALDMTFVAGSRLIMDNCAKQPSSTVTRTTARLVKREKIADIGIREEWVYDSDFSAGAVASNVYHSGEPFSLATNAVVAIADNSFTGYLFISTSEDVNAIFLCRGGTQTTAEVNDTDGFFSNVVNTANAYNVYWDAGTSRYVIQSKRPVTADVAVFRLGTNA